MNTLVKAVPGVQSDAAPARRRIVLRDWFVAAVVRGFPPVLGFAIFVLAWQGIAAAIPALPTPAVTWKAAVALFADPFYRNGPNDQGVGWNVLASLARVGAGFGMAAVIGIPAGFLIGRFAFLNAMASPIITGAILHTQYFVTGVMRRRQAAARSSSIRSKLRASRKTSATAASTSSAMSASTWAMSG